ncbi:MAG: hypothetical protein Q7T16_04545 [Candidatus Burarchaeum sp.]|nr:hypothetical protein [Candidatus Burarchaeum sp.]MDO8339897.1 hypothetical protein [Candidatus Burarchaeum sp.]
MYLDLETKKRGLRAMLWVMIHGLLVVSAACTLVLLNQLHFTKWLYIPFFFQLGLTAIVALSIIKGAVASGMSAAAAEMERIENLKLQQQLEEVDAYAASGNVEKTVEDSTSAPKSASEI